MTYTITTTTTAPAINATTTREKMEALAASATRCIQRELANIEEAEERIEELTRQRDTALWMASEARRSHGGYSAELQLYIAEAGYDAAHYDTEGDLDQLEYRVRWVCRQLSAEDQAELYPGDLEELAEAIEATAAVERELFARPGYHG